MIPAAFDYVRADSPEQAISMLGEYGDDAKLLAGGHSLLPLMKLRLASPSVLIDVGRLTDLSYVRDGGDHIAIGALTRHRDLETSELLTARGADPRRTPPARSAIRRSAIAAPSAARWRMPTRPPTCQRWCSRWEARWSPVGRAVSARSPRRDFYRGFLESALEPDELLTEIRVPKVPAAGWSFQKFNRRAQDWAIVGVAAVRHNGSSGVALVNMGSTPIYAQAVVDALASGAVGDRRGRAGGRRRRAPVRHQRHGRVPQPPGQGAGPPGPRGGRQLSGPWQAGRIHDVCDAVEVIRPSPGPA